MSNIIMQRVFNMKYLPKETPFDYQTTVEPVHQLRFTSSIVPECDNVIIKGCKAL